MFLNVHTHHLSNQSDVLELYNQFPTDWNNDARIFSIWIHPAYIDTSTLEKEIELIS